MPHWGKEKCTQQGDITPWVPGLCPPSPLCPPQPRAFGAAGSLACPSCCPGCLPSLQPPTGCLPRLFPIQFTWPREQNTWRAALPPWPSRDLLAPAGPAASSSPPQPTEMSYSVEAGGWAEGERSCGLLLLWQKTPEVCKRRAEEREGGCGPRPREGARSEAWRDEDEAVEGGEGGERRPGSLWSRGFKPIRGAG